MLVSTTGGPSEVYASRGERGLGRKARVVVGIWRSARGVREGGGCEKRKQDERERKRLAHSAEVQLLPARIARSTPDGSPPSV